MRRAAEAKQLTTMIGQVLREQLGRATGRIGVDVVYIPGWKRSMKVAGELFLRRVFTDEELDYAAGRPEQLATRFAAKEATVKLLGTGNRGGVRLRDVEVQTAPEGAPSIRLHGKAAARAKRIGVDGVGVSLCHEQNRAYAVAIGYKDVAA